MNPAGRISKWAIVTNLLVVSVATYFAIALARDLTRPQPLPPPPVPRQARANDGPAEAASPRPADDRLDQYNVIVAKHLFNPSRAEAPAAAPVAAAAPLPPKPILHGIVLDGEKSRAYLEDPGTKRVMSYRVGDAVAGGQLQTIGSDRVAIDRHDGQINIMLKDPTKPAPPAAVAEAQQPGGAAQRPSARAGGPTPPAVRPQRSANPFAPLVSAQQPGAAPQGAHLPAPIPPDQMPAQR